MRLIRSGWLRAPAKLNLTLRITGVREDGYHLLDSLVAPLTLCDHVLCRLELDRPELELRVAVPGWPELAGEGNLVARVARAFLTEVGMRATLAVTLIKEIPSGAGLGGGSSDAATVLAWLNDVVPVAHWPRARLAAWGVRFGADIPLFLHGGTGRMRGIGEDVERAAGPRRTWVALAKPGLGCPTPQVYRRYDELVARRLPAGSAAPPRSPTGAPTRIDALTDGDWPGLEPGRANDLFEAARDVCPALDEVCTELAAAGADDVRMSGSGSACYALCDTRAAAALLLRRLPPRPTWWTALARLADAVT